MPKTAAIERAAPRTIIEEKDIEETIKNMPEDSFTVLDFMKTLRSIYPEVWEKLVKRFRLWGVKEDTLWQHTFQIDLTCIRINHTQSWLHSRTTAKAGSRITEKLRRKKGDISEVHG